MQRGKAKEVMPHAGGATAVSFVTCTMRDFGPCMLNSRANLNFSLTVREDFVFRQLEAVSERYSELKDSRNGERGPRDHDAGVAKGDREC
jgi:hypothetical protein